MNDEYNLKKGVVTYFMALPQNLPEETGKPRTNSM
jgi:hypothetical protein